jgi:hypothetical protein
VCVHVAITNVAEMLLMVDNVDTNNSLRVFDLDAGIVCDDDSDDDAAPADDE